MIVALTVESGAVMRVVMSCSTCGYVISAISYQSLSESYLAHRDAAHPVPPRVTSGEALRKLVSLVQMRG